MSDRRRRRRFEELFAEHRQAVLGFFVRRVDQPADAADLLSEVFLVVWRRLDDVPPADEARLWLFGVAQRVLSNHRRGTRRRIGLAPELEQVLEVDVAPDAAHGIEHKDLVARVRVAMATLDEADRDVLTLYAWEQLSSAEIALVVGAPPSTVRVRLHRARKRLHAAVGEAHIAAALAG